MAGLAGVMVTLLTLLAAGTAAAQTDYYVDAARPDNDGDGTSWETAKQTIQAAVDLAEETGTVWVANGVYDITAEILIDKAVTVRSVNGPDVTIVQRTGYGEHRIFHVNHADARLDGFTIRNGFGQHGSGVYLVDGTVANCVIRDNPVKSWAALDGMGIWMSGGTVTNCVIRNNGSPSSTFFNGNGGGVYMSGGLLTHSTVVSNLFWTNRQGMGIHANGSDVLISHCTISHNKETRDGSAAGLYLAGGATLRNSLVSHNSTAGGGSFGGGIRMTGAATLVESCTIVDNSAGGTSGGIYMDGGSVSNSIVYFNSAGTDPNVRLAGSGLTYSCAMPLPAGTGNTALEPQFEDCAGGNYYLKLGGGRGTGFVHGWMSTATDLGGGPRLDFDGRVDMGAFQTQAGALACSLVADFPSFGKVPVTVNFSAAVEGTNTTGLVYRWDFNNNGSFELEGGAHNTASHEYTIPGVYSVRLVVENAVGEVAAFTNAGRVVATLADLYVSGNGANLAPYTNLATAATSFLDAFDVAGAGTRILVDSNTYTVARTVELDRAVQISGLHGAAKTTLERTGTTSFRVIHMTHPDAVIEGLTIRNGRSTGAGIYMTAGMVCDGIIRDNRAEVWGQSGGGIYMTGGTVTNCVIRNNYAQGGSGGGVYLSGGELRSSTVVSNDLFSNQHGAGVMVSGPGVLVSHCTIAGNRQTRDGTAGGVHVAAGAVLRNSLVKGNAITGNGPRGGGVYITGADTVVENCTIVSNSVASASGDGGGIYSAGGSVRNSIMVYNTAAANPNYSGAAAGLTYSFTEGLIENTGNKAGDPLFVDAAAGDYRLQYKPVMSPAIDAGTPPPNRRMPYEGDLAWLNTAVDLAGNPRYSDHAVDMGAYETELPPAGSLFLLR